MANCSLLLSLLTLALLYHGASTSQEDACQSTFDFNVFHYYTSVPHRQKLHPILMKSGPQLSGRDPNEPSFEFTGGSGLIVNDTKLINKMSSLLCSANELAVYSSVFFKNDQSGGTSLELYHVNETFLGLSVCRISNVIHVAYRHGSRLRFETFPFKFSSGKWYKLAVLFSGNMLTVFVNCSLLEKRIVPMPDYCPSPDKLSLITGSGCLTKELSPCTTGFTGSLQSVELNIGKSASVKGCTGLNKSAQCPVCGSFLTLLKNHYKLQETLSSVQSSLDNCTKTLNAINCSSSTHSSTSCIIHKKNYPDGAFVRNSTGHICYCRDGVAHCIANSSISMVAEESQQTRTLTPPTSAPAATKTCLATDTFGPTVTLAPGESKYFPLPSENKCGIITCKSLSSKFIFNSVERIDCDSNVPSSNCNNDDESKQKLAVCCGRCTVCESVARCPMNSSCVPKGVDYDCECNKGFEMTNSNTSCTDINECSTNTHNCPSDASCINSVGSFTCKCPAGFELSEEGNNTLKCIDIDECNVVGMASCDANSNCMNTRGSYNCQCKEGYTKNENGRCIAFCERKCLNGGECIAPNTCRCVPGFNGQQCQNDINECLGQHECTHNNSKCINTHGGYFCNCKEGYQWKESTRECIDVNECASGIHYCPEGSRCLNTFGGYQCPCKGGSQCTGYCKNDKDYIAEGASISLGVDQCDSCVCKENSLMCKRKECKCDDRDVSKVCCPHCFEKDVCHIDKVAVDVDDYLVDPQNRCIRKKCVKDSHGRLSISTTDLSASCTPVSGCPANHTYIPEGGCCPVCQLPSCTATNRPPAVTLNCETCTCDGSSWSCTKTTECPSHQQLGCSKDELIKLPNQCCPVCHQEIIDKLTCSST